MTEFAEPKELKRLRACIRCKLLKTESQWLNNRYCENCGNISEDNITSNFKGFIAYTDPKNSWAAKWLNNDHKNLKPGIYCINVDNVEENEDNYEDEIVDDDA